MDSHQTDWRVHSTTLKECGEESISSGQESTISTTSTNSPLDIHTLKSPC